MFDWIWKGAGAMWVAWNYWSIVPIIIIMVVGAVIWKTAITPKEYQDRLAWEQKKENHKLTQARVNMIGTIFLKWLLGFMASTFFCIAIFKMFS